jgi:hypothetical protein
MLIFPLLKASAEARRVTARLDETIDRAGEAMDYALSAPAFRAWSETQFAASGGKSYGNVRAQHDLRKAAGIVSEIRFDDAARVIEFELEIVDDGEWEKLIKGVYTGISPGGSAKRFLDQRGARRFAVSGLNEISLVDLPCGPSATFTLIKADGAEEQIEFQPASASEAGSLLKAVAEAGSPQAQIGLVAWMAADDLEKALGAVDDAGIFSAATRRTQAADGVALPDGSFPVTDAASLAGGFTALEKAADQDAARLHLIARATALGLEAELPGADPKLVKGMYSVSRFSDLISSLTSLAADVTDEAAWEADGSAIPGRLAIWVSQGAVILTDMAGEESAELVAGLRAAVAALPVVEIDTDLVKAAGLQDRTLLLKAYGDLAGARDDLTKAHAATAIAQAEVSRLAALPASGGARLRAISRGDDVSASAAKTDPASDALAAIAAMPDGIEKATLATKLAMFGVLPTQPPLIKH